MHKDQFFYLNFFYSMCLQFEKPLQSLHFEIEKTFAFELKYYKQFFFYTDIFFFR